MWYLIPFVSTIPNHRSTETKLTAWKWDQGWGKRVTAKGGGVTKEGSKCPEMDDGAGVAYCDSTKSY